MRNKIKIIPDRLFFKLWREANSYKYLNVNDYVSVFTSYNSKSLVDLKKYNLDYLEFTNILSNIYTVSNLSFEDIIKKVGCKKADISNIFCIPIRTVEDWYKNIHPCPSYIRLMIIRNFYLLDLGKYIYLESDISKIKNKPKVYKTKTTGFINTKNTSGKNNDNPINTSIDKSFNNKVNTGKLQILKDTQYLNYRIKRWKNNNNP